MQVCVERLADRLNHDDAELLERLFILRHNHFESLAAGVVLRRLRECAGQAVVHGQELLERFAPHVGVDVLALLGAAAAEVVVLSQQAEVFVPLGGELLLQRLFGRGLFGLLLSLFGLLLGLFVRLLFGFRRCLGFFFDFRFGFRRRLLFFRSGFLLVIAHLYLLP